MDQIKIIFPRLYQLDTIYSADCHGRRTEKKKNKRRKTIITKLYLAIFQKVYV